MFKKCLESMLGLGASSLDYLITREICATFQITDDGYGMESVIRRIVERNGLDKT
jgi:hypothetical protein